MIGSAAQVDNEMKGDMTPMIDVVFQLLIFFMLTIKFKTLEGKLSAFLPKDVGVNTSQAEPKEKVEIKMKVLKEGTKMHPTENKPWEGEGPYRWGSDRQIMYSVGPKNTAVLDEAVNRLRELFKADKESPVSIDPFPGTTYDDVVDVLDRVIEVGFRDVSFVGDRSAQMKK